MRAAEPAGGSDHSAVVEVTALIRRVIAARVHDRQLVDDLVQEALTRVMSARQRLEPAALAPYAAVTARNLVASLAATESRNRRHAHRLIDLRKPELPEEELLRREELRAVTTALANLPVSEREALVAHEVEGKRTSWLAASRQSTPGAVATQLSRARARLRVEYLLALEQSEPPTPRCRQVLLALSSGDRRRQRELDAGRHLLDCRLCANLSNQLLDRRRTATATDEVHIPIESDADVVAARKQGRELARKADFSATDLTIIATAISEIARNIVMFAERGEIVVRLVGDGDRRGVTVTARDAGPGIADVEDALEHGTSSYGGLGLGLPGARRLMDEFEVSSEPGRGTTVIMTKWRPGRR